MSRNLDFTAGDFRGRLSKNKNGAAMARPFVVECYPTAGHASLFLCSNDLLGAAFDGINAKGLTVALLTDRDLMNRYRMEPSRDLQPGVNELQNAAHDPRAMRKCDRKPKGS